MTERDRPLEESLESHSKQPPSVAERALEREAKLLTGWQQEVSKGLELGLQGADSIIERSIPTFSRGELPYFAGINTFLKAPYIEPI